MQPSRQPSSQPSSQPSNPSHSPTLAPTYAKGFPTPLPTTYPTLNPTTLPTNSPSSAPTSLNKYVDNIVGSISSLTDTLNYIAPDTTDDYILSTIISTKNISCPLYCYNNGACTFVDMNTGMIVKNCNVSSPLATCIVKCDCQEDWYGYDCKINYEQHNQITEMQKNILTNLAAVSDQVTTPDQVLMVIDSSTFVLESASKQSLLVESIELSNNIVSSVLSSASTMSNINVDNFVSFTSIIDTIITSSTTSQTSNMDIEESRSTKEAVNDLVENFVDGIGDLAIRDNIELKKESNNMVIQVVPSTGTHKLSALGGKTHQFSLKDKRQLDISSSRELASPDLIVLSVTRASIYDTNSTASTNSSSKLTTSMTSNPVRVLYKCQNQSAIARFVLQSFNDNEYDDILSINSTIFTKCSYGEQSQHKYTCAYTDGSTYSIKVKCDGWTSNVIRTSCPNRKRAPTCGVLTTNGHCTLQSYSNSMVECICDICTSTHNRRLRNVNLVATQVSAITTYVFNEYVSTMSEADTLSWNDIR